MKRLFLTAMAACLCVLAWGQDPFICLTQGAEIKYVQLDARGKETGTTVTTIDKVTGSGKHFDVTQTMTIYDKKGEVIMPAMTVESSIDDGAVSMALNGGLAVEIDSDVPVIPAQMEVGQDLGTGEMRVNVSGLFVTQEITLNKVVAREEITVPAGTYDCFVVEQNITVKLGPIKVSSVQKTWYSRGIGMVKSESYDKKGKIATSQQLASIAN